MSRLRGVERLSSHAPLSAGLVVAVGPLPPPVHGAARVNSAILEAVIDTGTRARAVDTGSLSASRVGYHLDRIWRHIQALGVLALYATRSGGGARTCYLTGAGGLGLWYQLLVVAAARTFRYPVVFHHHSFAYLTCRRRVMDLMVRAGGPSMTHVVLCNGMRDLLSSLYPSAANQTMLVCSNAGLYSSIDHPTATRRAERELVLAHLSNLTIAKGLPVVFETFRRVSSNIPGASLLLGGPPADRAAADLIELARKEFGHRLRYVGALDPEEIDGFFDQADLMLFPSTYSNEAEPLVVIEAARRGVPTVAYDVGCLRSLVADANMLVPIKNDFPLAVVQIVDVLKDYATRAELSDRTVQHIIRRRADASDAMKALVGMLAGQRAN